MRHALLLPLVLAVFLPASGLLGGLHSTSVEFAEVQGLAQAAPIAAPTAATYAYALPAPFAGACGYQIEVCASDANGVPTGNLTGVGSVKIWAWDTGPKAPGVWAENPQLAETVTVTTGPCQIFAAHSAPGYASMYVEPQTAGIVVAGGATNLKVIVGISRCSL